MASSLILIWSLRLAGLIAMTSAAGSATWFATVREGSGSDSEVSTPGSTLTGSPLSVDWSRSFIVRIGNPDRATSDEQQLAVYVDAVAAGCVRAIGVLRVGEPGWLDDARLNELNANRNPFGIPPLLIIELPDEAALADPAVMEASAGCR